MTSSYLHRGIGRPKAEQLLLEAAKDGSYLVRESETIPGGFTLCLLFDGKVYQYRILPDSGQLYIKREGGNERKYVDLLQLIHEVQKRGSENGLITALKHPVAVQNTDEGDRDSEDEEGAGKRSEGNRQSTNNVEHAGPSDEFVNRLFMQRFRHLDLSSQDGEFANLLREYVENGIQTDYHRVASGSEEMPQLTNLLDVAVKDLDRQVEFFLSKVGMLKQLFGKNTPSPGVLRKYEKESSVKSTLEYLGHLKPAITSLEQKAMKYLANFPSEDAVDLLGEAAAFGDNRSGDSRIHRASTKLFIPASHFEVTTKHNQRITITVDIQQGKLFLVRPNKNTLDANSVFLHDKIEQLIKCTKNNCRLEIKIEGRKKESYLFSNVRQREYFCQVVQQLKNLHSLNEDVEQISIFIGTWNMGFEAPHWNLKSWLRSHGVGKTRPKEFDQLAHHLYVIGTQEGSMSEKDWVNKIKGTLQEIVDEDMHVVGVQTMWHVRLLVLVQAHYKHKISHLQTSSVKTGIANTLGNKGANGIAFQFEGTSLCFINAHLTSGHERNNRRNQNVKDIMKGLGLGPKNLSHFDLTTQFQHLFFLGDLNYRLEGIEATEIINKVTQLEKLPENQRDYSCLLFHDQLLRSQQEKEVFCQFREEEISFSPTYRYAKGSTDKYEWQKHKKTGVRINAPSWCDRVLWKSFPETFVVNTSYGCVQDLSTSDHKPVFASFDVAVASQFVSTKSKAGEDCTENTAKIVFKEIHAELKTRCKGHFQIEFQSTSIDGAKLSQANTQFRNSASASTVCPEWIDRQLPILEPIIDDREYLEDQHVLLAVKSHDGMESFGECVLALKSMFSVIPQSFETFLVHDGEETGKIKGLMRVEVKGSLLVKRIGRARKSYEFVSTDRDELQNFTRPPSIDRAISALPDFARSFDEDEPDGGVVWLDNTVYDSKSRRALRSHSSSEISETSFEIVDPESCVVTEESIPEENKPVLPSRKPRLGQLSIAQMGVLPILTAVQDAHAKKKENLTEEPHKPLSSKSNESKAGISKITRKGSNERSAVGQSSFRGAVVVSMDSLEEAGDAPGSSPPQLPPRQPKAENKPQLPHRSKAAESYVQLRQPASVSEWLQSLGLPLYAAPFIKNGWDQINFLSEVTEQDLKSMGITSSEHRKRILQSIKDMGSKKSH